MPEAPRRPVRRPLWLVPYVGATLLFIALLAYACTGPRGSDQFWYIADTETLLAGKPPLTNSIYPGPLLRENIPLHESYFLHHTPVNHVVLPFARLFGVFGGWVVMNAAAVIAAAGLVAFAVHRLCGPQAAALGYALMLLLPLTIWQTANPLQEAVFCLLTTALTVGYVLADEKLSRWIPLLVIGVVAALCNPFYLPVAAALPVVYLWRNRGRLRPWKLALPVVALAAVVTVQVLRPRWFPSSFQPSLKAIVLSAAAGVTNMEWHYRVQLPELSAALLLTKMTDAVRTQFTLSSAAIFVWPVNLFFLAALPVVRSWRKDPRLARLALAAGIWVLLFWVLVFVHQNQFRYSLMIAPPLLIAALAAAGRAHIRRVAVVAGVASMLFLAADGVIAARLRAEGLNAEADVARVRALIADYPLDSPAVIESRGAGEPLLLTYALHPRPCLLLIEGYLDRAERRRALDRFGPRLVFCRPGAEILEQAGAEPLPGAPRPVCGVFHAYRVPAQK